MAPVSRTQSTAPAPSADASPAVNPKVVLAEAIASECQTSHRYLVSAEFKRRVLGFAVADHRNVHSYFPKLLSRLNPDERARVLAAHKNATGESLLDPESVQQRLHEFATTPAPLSQRMPADSFHKLLFRGYPTATTAASFRSLYAFVRRGLPAETQSALDHMRQVATGLEPERGGNVGVDVGAVVNRAEHLAQQVADRTSDTMTAAGFQRRALDVAATVTDTQVKRRFSELVMGVSAKDRERLQRAQTLAMGRAKKAATTKEYDLAGMVERAKSVARETATEGQPVSLLEFYQRALGYDTTNLDTLKVRASQYAGRLSPDQKKKFEEAKAVAIGKKPMSAAEAGQVFAPDAGQMEETAALVRAMGAETFVPTSRLPETLSRPYEPVDPKTLQLPGLVADVMNVVKPLGLPIGEIDWRKFAIPPSEARLHVPNADTDAIDLPEDLPPPASLPSTPLPRIRLDPVTVGILAVAGVLVAADGPLPFGDAAAASLVGGRLAVR